MDRTDVSVLIGCLETSVSYSNQLKTVLLRDTKDTSDAHYKAVMFDYNKLTEHIANCYDAILKLKEML